MGLFSATEVDTQEIAHRYEALLIDGEEVLIAFKTVRDIAWKAQLRLCGRYRKLMARGKRQGVVTTAIAREMAAFLWAIGREVEPQQLAG